MPGKQTWTGMVVRECFYRTPEPPPPCKATPCQYVAPKKDWTQLAIIGLLVLIVLLLLTGKAHAQTQNFPGGSSSGGGGTSSTFGQSFPSTGTAAGATDGVNMQPLKVDGSDNLNVNCTVGCSGGATTPADAFANPSTAGLSFSFLAGFNGSTWDRIRDDANKALMVDVGNTTLAVTQSGTWNIGTVTTITNSVAVTQSTSPWVVSCTVANCAINLSQVGGSSFALGQQLAAASLPIVLTASQLSTLTPPAAIANYALETGGNLATLAGGVTSSTYQENLKQVNGVTTLTGAGASGTGAQRETVSQDTTTIAGSAPGTAGTPSANVLTVQGATSGTNLNINIAASALSNSTVNETQIGSAAYALGSTVMSGSAPTVEATNQGNPCANPNSAIQSVFGATSGTALTQIIALSASKQIFICNVTLTEVSGTTPTYGLEYGTATNCGTGTTVLVGAPSATIAAAGVNNFSGNPWIVPASNALCYKMGGTTPIFNYSVTFVQQ